MRDTSTTPVQLSIQLHDRGDSWAATEPGVDAVGEGDSACDAVRAYADEIKARKEELSEDDGGET